MLELATTETEKVTPGTVGFLVVAAIGIALWFLIKSMNKQIKKIDFKGQNEDRDTDEPRTP